MRFYGETQICNRVSGTTVFVFQSIFVAFRQNKLHQKIPNPIFKLFDIDLSFEEIGDFVAKIWLLVWTSIFGSISRPRG